MIGSQALVGLMADGLLSMVEQLISSGGPEIVAGTIAIAILTVLALGAALRADLTKGEAKRTDMPLMGRASAPASLAVASEPAARAPKSAAAKRQAVRSAVRLDLRRPARAPSRQSAKRYRPANVLSRPLSRSAVIRPASARGLLLFVERRSSGKGAKPKMA